jgi:hypothetical protein
MRVSAASIASTVTNSSAVTCLRTRKCRAQLDGGEGWFAPTLTIAHRSSCVCLGHRRERATMSMPWLLLSATAVGQIQQPSQLTFDQRPTAR